ncbi:MAG TPA: Uma2 family endonuclease [Blastocatellia bacterium]|nr:Uma2 family endonuclease [Blastocatellia bacterium]
MSIESADYLGVIGHLPEGAMLRLEQVSWDDYEQLLDDLAAQSGVRVTFNAGSVEIMSPTHEHEKFRGFITRMAQILSEELGVVLEALGSTTYKLKRLLQGVEPDECFYVEHASDIIGKKGIDLNVDPPPDIVVEIDITSDSLSKFPIYAALGVPEIWRYDGEQTTMHQLTDAGYVEIPASRSFPVLTAQALTEFIGQSKTQGQTVALAAFRQWVREQPRF